ncbi:MAG: ZPR1 zinc finger domain-containing protein [Candidatus Diapherotrites archaeon]
MKKKDEEPHSIVHVPCPQCKKEAVIIQLVENVPYFGRILLQSLSCSHCGMKWSDVMSLEFNSPTGFDVRIHKEKDLETKIVRNSSGTVEIPELGVVLEPGSFAEGFFTNIEGLLERVSDVLSVLMKSDNPKQAKAAKERIRDLTKCKEGKMSFTVRVLDPYGGSALIGKNVRRFSLSKKEAALLKKGVAVL